MGSPVLVISDPQFHNYKAHSRIVDGVNSRLLNIADAWRQAVAVGVDHGCKTLLVPGDVFEVRGTIRPSVLKLVADLFYATTLLMDIVVISGNHDQEGGFLGDSSIATFDYIGGKTRSDHRVYAMEAPGFVCINGHRIGCVPYIQDSEKFKEAFVTTCEGFVKPGEGHDFVMIHQGIDDFAEDLPLTTGITVKWLMKRSGRAWVISGHYHNPFAVGKVINAGALVQHRFGDEGSDRGCWVIFPDEGKASFFKIESPRFVTVGVDTKSWPEPLAGNFVRIKAPNVKVARAIRRVVEKEAPLSVVVEIEREFKPAHDVPIRIASPVNMLAEYLKLNKQYRGQADDILRLFYKVCLGM